MYLKTKEGGFNRDGQMPGSDEGSPLEVGCVGSKQALLLMTGGEL